MILLKKVHYTLGAGESIVVDTGYLAAMSESCQMDIVSVPGVKNMLFGGEGLFNTVFRPAWVHENDTAVRLSDEFGLFRGKADLEVVDLTL